MLGKMVKKHLVLFYETLLYFELNNVQWLNNVSEHVT